MSLRRLLSLQKRLYRSLQCEADRQLGEVPESIRRYEKEFRRDFSGFQLRMRRTKKEALIRAIRKADVTLIADYHTFSQSYPQYSRDCTRLVG